MWKTSKHKQSNNLEITKAEDTQLWHLLSLPENLVHVVELQNKQHFNLHYKHQHIFPNVE